MKITINNFSPTTKSLKTSINENKRINENIDKDLMAIACFIYQKGEANNFKNNDDFYIYLLNELKKFERSFGEYIYKICFDNIHFSILSYKYFKKGAYTINAICAVENLVAIDSFNYTYFVNESEKFNEILTNINGNIDNPIFGIDSSKFPYNDIRSIFAKTNRRIELDMLKEEQNDKVEFDNAIIYGHSLSKNDYSYFYPLLDQLEMTNFQSKKMIVFVFSIYDESRIEEIQFEHRSAIIKLFASYAHFKGYNEEPERLLDSLTTQGRILTYELSN